MESALIREARTLFDLDQESDASPLPASGDEDPTAGPGQETEAAGEPVVMPVRLTRRQERQLWRHVATVEGFWESLDEIEPGSVEKLAAASRDRRWEVLFLTKRPEVAGLTSQVQSQRWL